MITLIRLTLLLIGAVALLTACDPRNEEEASLAPAQELSAADLIQQVMDAEKSIHSIREDRTDVSTQVAALTGDADNTSDEERHVRIQVGEDSYLKYEFIAPDFCEGDPECLDFANPVGETLYYKGSSYVRSGTEWTLESESGCFGTDETVACVSVPIEHWLGTEGTGGFVSDCPALESVEPVEVSQIYSFDFSWLTNLDRIEGGSDGSSLIQVRGTIDEPFWSLGLSPEIEVIYGECGIDPQEQFDLADIPASMGDYFPERFKGQADFWIDAATFYVHRLEYQLDSLNGDRLITSNSTGADYSLFNEAELPGPLPE